VVISEILNVVLDVAKLGPMGGKVTRMGFFIWEETKVEKERDQDV